MSDDLSAHVARFQARVCQDAWAEAWSVYWVRRAETFEAAAARPGDFTGQATEAEQDERARRIVETAVACRNRATLVDGLADEQLAEAADAWARGAA